MSYLVLARKYRPKNFSEMVGQGHVVQALGNALTTGRLHHAYLFTGTRGVGKTTVSRILAKSLNCLGADGTGGITANPCGVCAACSAIDSGRFVDYTELDAASNRGVDEVQSLLEQAAYKPVQGRFKVFMIDEVHMLSNTAFNAMLKTLEEPPEYLKFVLATTDPQKVPVTVLSRCLQFNLRPMAPETILEHLQLVLQAESVPAEVQALRLLARAARGSMRDALSLTDQAIAFGNGQLQEVGVRQMLGTVDRSYVFGLIEALAQSDGKSVVETCEQLRVNGLSAASTLEEMSSVLQRMAVLQAVPQAQDNADPQAEVLAQLAQALPADQTQLLYSICLQGRAELGLAPDEYAGLTMVLLRLLAFQPSSAGAAQEKKSLKSARPEPVPTRPQSLVPTAVEAAVKAPETAPETAPISATAARPVLPQTLAPLPAPAAPPLHSLANDSIHTPDVVKKVAIVPASTASEASNFVAIQVRNQPEAGPRGQVRAQAADAAKTEFEPTSEGDFWHGLVSLLVEAEAVSALTRELALQSQLMGRDADLWTLRTERESLGQAATRDKLQAALASAGHAVRIAVEIGPVRDAPAKRNAAAAAQRQREAEAIILADPFVQDMLQNYGAKIVSGSLRAT